MPILVLSIDSSGAVTGSKSYTDAVKQVKGESENAVKAHESSGSALASLAARYLTTAAALGAVVAIFRTGIAETLETERATNKLNSVLQATGKGSDLFKSQLDQLAESMEKTTLFEKDQVVNAEALLATYANISDKTFPEVIKTAGDLAAVMGTDLTSATMMLGKALTDPTEGMTLLGRAGVRLTDQQKDLIKTIEATKGPMEAQAALIGMIQGKVGGAAEGQQSGLTGAINQLTDAWKNFAETTVSVFTPLMEALLTRVSKGINELTEIVSSFNAFYEAYLSSGYKGKAGTQGVVPGDEVSVLKEVTISGKSQADQDAHVAQVNRNLRAGGDYLNDFYKKYDDQIKLNSDIYNDAANKKLEADIKLTMSQLELKNQFDAAWTSEKNQILGLDGIVESAYKAGEGFKTLGERLQGFYQEHSSMVQGWENNFTNAVTNMVTGAKSSWKDMVNSMIQDLVRLWVQKNITQGIFGNIFGGAFGGAASVASVETPTGGASMTGGGGGIGWGNSTAANIGGGDIGLSFAPSRAPAAGSSVTVQIIDNRSSGEKVQVTRTRDNSGDMIRVVINEVISAGNRGDLDNMMAQNYGVVRAGGA